MTTTTGTRAILLALVLVLAAVSWDMSRGAAQLVPGGPIVMTVNSSGDLVPVHATARNTLWVWQPVPVDDLLTAAREHRVVRLLVWCPPGFSRDTALTSWLEQLDDAAGEHGIALDALGGDPVWAQRPALAATWAAEVAATARFDHLHLDVEPHALDTWEQESGALVDGLVAAVTAAAGTGMAVDVDVPYWLDRYTTSAGQGALDAVAEVASSLTVMAYQSTIERITAVAAPVLAVGARDGIPVWIGVNLLEPTQDEAASSLWGQDRVLVERVLATVGETDGAEGVAIHDAASLLALRDG